MRAPLPIDCHLEPVRESVKNQRFTILTAAPGTGKTTRIPDYLERHSHGLILVLEPRRLAARVSAERVAEERGEPIGQSVGYATRYDRKQSDQTKLIYLTEGLFLQWVRKDPNLSDVACVILDEFHERNLHTDVALATVRFVQQTNPDLKCLIMSATIDSAAIADRLPAANCLHVPGQTYPVVIEHVTNETPQLNHDSITISLQRMLKDARCPGDILVFLPGLRDIQRCIQLARQSIREPNIDFLPLSAQTPIEMQRQIFSKSSRQKIIFATNVAETSITIPGVTGVIDSGLAKIAGHAPWSGMPTLEVKKICQAACNQRAGRAGRTSSGVVYRLYSESDFLRRESEQIPEVHRVDFSSTLLLVLDFLKHVNQSQNVTNFPWLETPHDKQIEAAHKLLKHLGAVSDDGTLTALGSQLAKLPLHPRSAAIFLKAKEDSQPALGLWTALIVESASRLRFRTTQHETLRSDIDAHLWALAHLEQLDRSTDPYKTLFTLHRDYRLIQRRICPQAELNLQNWDQHQISLWVLAGYPDRVAKLQKRRTKHGDALYHFCLGKSGKLHQGSHAHNSPFIIALDVTENLGSNIKSAQSTIHFAVNIHPERLQDTNHTLAAREDVTRKDHKDKEARSFRIHTYGQFTVSEIPIETLSDLQVPLSEMLTDSWHETFPSPNDLEIYHNKLALLDSLHIEHNLPVFTGEFFSLLVEHMCENCFTLTEVRNKRLGDSIKEMLTYEQQQFLQHQTPESLRLRNGKTIIIEYREQNQPQATAYIQDLFGIETAPKITSRQVAMLWNLLAPNGRPAQLTSDLDGFWKRTYPELSKALSRRYPKHYWPENPLTAMAVRYKKLVK